MQGSLDQPPLVIRGSRVRGALVFVGGAIFVAAGSVVIRAGETTVGMLSIGFFGLCAVMGLLMLITPARLEIGPAGFSQTMLWRTFRYAWADVLDFRVVNLTAATTCVGFNFANPDEKRAGLRRFNRSISGVNATLNPGWEIKPSALAAVLTEARQKWLLTKDAADAVVAHPQPLPAFTGQRMNRKAYWIAMGVFAALIFCLNSIPVLHSKIGNGLAIITIWIFTVRLHDLGRSGWWQLALYASQIAIVVFAMLVAKWSEDAALASALVLELIFVVGLGALPGTDGPNRFGPAPGSLPAS